MLLAALPAADWEQARKDLKPIIMPLGDLLNEPGMRTEHLYFHTTSVISISCVMTDGWTDAIALIGCEGFAGVEVFLGADSAPCRALVLSEGCGYQIKREALNQLCARGGSMRSVLLRYTRSYIAQVAQTIACNRHHSIDQQLCRWLLMYLDRQASNEPTLTHEHIAELMGVRRESVTHAASRLQTAGCIRYHRGHISVVERTGLEARSCECYGIGRRETDRLLEISPRNTKMAVPHAAVEGFRIERSTPAANASKILPKGKTSCCTPLRSY